MSNLIYRPFELSDIDTLAALSRTTFSEKFGHLYKPENLSSFLADNHSEKFYRNIHSEPSNELWVAQLPENGLTGYILLASALSLPAVNPPKNSKELKRLYISSQYHGQGIGQKLLDIVLGLPNVKNAEAIYLSVYSENFGAQRFYKRNGFSQVGEFYFQVGTDRDREFLYCRLRPETQ